MKRALQLLLPLGALMAAAAVLVLQASAGVASDGNTLQATFNPNQFVSSTNGDGIVEVIVTGDGTVNGFGAATDVVGLVQDHAVTPCGAGSYTDHRLTQDQPRRRPPHPPRSRRDLPDQRHPRSNRDLLGRRPGQHRNLRRRRRHRQRHRHRHRHSEPNRDALRETQAREHNRLKKEPDKQTARARGENTRARAGLAH